MLRTKMLNGGVRLPDLADSLYQFPAPERYGTCRVVMLRGAMDSSAEEARGIHVNRGHPSARQPARILVGSDGASARLLDFAATVYGVSARFVRSFMRLSTFR